MFFYISIWLLLGFIPTIYMFLDNYIRNHDSITISDLGYIVALSIIGPCTLIILVTMIIGDIANFKENH